MAGTAFGCKTAAALSLVPILLILTTTLLYTSFFSSSSSSSSVSFSISNNIISYGNIKDDDGSSRQLSAADSTAPGNRFLISDSGDARMNTSSSPLVGSDYRLNSSSDVPLRVGNRKQQRRDNGEYTSKVERDLVEARAAIKKAVNVGNNINMTPYPGAETLAFSFDPNVYRNPRAFYQSHQEMVRRFKIWSYKEGEVPLSHIGPSKNIYAIDGIFMGEIDGGLSNKFMASRPEEAHAFYIPMSTVKLVEFMYRPQVYSYAPFQKVFTDYVKVVAHKHPFWNRSLGGDHFMVSCHDWAPFMTRADPDLFKHFIRGICNANMTEGFEAARDVAIPEIKVPYYNDLRPLPPNLYSNNTSRNNNRPIFAFFAGRAHGYVRDLLYQHWKNVNDTEMQIHEFLPGGSETYFNMLGSAKFCLCPSGYEVASPRVVEAIHVECVPVLISDGYSLPFSDVLDWNNFSISIPLAKIPEIKTILKGVSDEKYSTLLQGVKSVKWHFTLNIPAKPFDMVHMILHSIWLRRLNIKLPTV